MERIHVSVRARPLSSEDTKSSPWKISSNSIFIPNHSSKFEFDRVFREECKTLEVYEARTHEIVGAAVRGFNGTVFAYGQTNSGKTHTMRGSAIEPGVIPLAVQDLFRIIHQDADREFLLRMSYMEIYNEEINDLLAPEHRKLQIHESLERGIYVAGLREEIVASPQQVLDLMQFGESHRHIGETNMNLYSSRSHTIFRMIIESRDRAVDEDASSSCDAVRVSVLNLVDLAGSERAAKTGAEGVRLKEGSHINKSLMTLGTVIKKLSEGAESQGGHVPYRDSKLTRILQPALGGNANTAIICNITLAQIHADETKSSLQFASRALRVTNCAHVNEILTDAALLKRQKKEIEELRAKLQDSHSEHLEEEILNLRNTLLQSELERERIALELEEEKRAQAAREKVLQEQAKKIKNLSSMVLCSARDENRDQYKKSKRRDTWCPGKLSRETLQEVDNNVQSRASVVNPMRASRDVGPLLPFEELLNVTRAEANILQQDEDCSNNNGLEDSALPNPCALSCITNRRKPLTKKIVLPVDDHGLEVMQAEYEELFLKFETQRTMSDVQIDDLRRQLVNADALQRMNSNCCATYDCPKSTTYADKNVSLRETDAILVIKQLQEKIKMLEIDKSSSQQNLDSVLELATEQNKCAIEKVEELQKELEISREEAMVALEQLASCESARNDVNDDSATKLSLEIEDIMSEIQNSTAVIEDVSLLLDEVFQSFSALFNVFSDFKASMCQSSSDQQLIFANQEKLHLLIKQRVTEVENEKLRLKSQSVDLQKQIEVLSHGTQTYEDSLTELSEQHELEKAELLSEIEILENELSCLSLNGLAKEKESLRKDLEKTKVKLKETESKLKNAIQEKTKLEGEKSFAEREVKRLQGQKTLLERDISKRDSLAGRRRDSVIERNPKGYDGKKPKGLADAFGQSMQEDYKKLEVVAFEMEATIASLEEELVAAQKEKEDAISRNEGLASELQAMCEKLELSNTELDELQNEVSSLKLSLDESTSEQKKIESSIKLLLEEKEELLMQLTESLLEIEEEKAIWSAKEKASIEAIEEKTKSCNAEIEILSKAMSEVRSELESCRNECKFLREKLARSEENVNLEKKCSAEKCADIDQLKSEMKVAAAGNMQSQEILKSILEVSSIDLHHARMKINELEKESSVLNEDRENLLARVELATGFESQNNSQAKARVEELNRVILDMEAKVQKDEADHSMEKAKLRMRLRGTQAKLDAFRFRHKELVDECDHMNRRFEEASRKLKDQLASSAVETLNLKKQLSVARNCH